MDLYRFVGKIWETKPRFYPMKKQIHETTSHHDNTSRKGAGSEVYFAPMYLLGLVDLGGVQVGLFAP